MSELRQDFTTKEWVIIAPERAKRPNSFAHSPQKEYLPQHDESCPFCPGNEDRPPPEVFRIEDGESGWRTRVVPNLYPALRPDGSALRQVEEGIFKKIGGIGVHEVIVETPLHNTSLAELGATEVADVLYTYRARYNYLKTLPFVRLISIFKNRGKGAGTSLAHPHSQLIATPIAAPRIRRKLDIALQYYDENGSCLYCDLVRHEIQAAKRVTTEGDSFLAFHPYASSSPFETWIVPKKHESSFGLISDSELPELAALLKNTLMRLRSLLGNFDFNYVICSSPTEDENNHYYDWHMIIVPRLTTPAGFEIGSGIPITTAAPERTAELVRKVQL